MSQLKHAHFPHPDRMQTEYEKKYRGEIDTSLKLQYPNREFDFSPSQNLKDFLEFLRHETYDSPKLHIEMLQYIIDCDDLSEMFEEYSDEDLQQARQDLIYRKLEQ